MSTHHFTTKEVVHASKINVCFVASFPPAGIVQSVYADIPKIISDQGKVTDAGGTSVSDGAYTMRFRIYDAAAGGTVLWNSGDQSVDVNGGVFSVLLGESPQDSIGLPFDQDYWLLVRFDGVNQTPRQKLVSTGYAYMSSGLVAGTEVIGSVTSGTYAAIKGTNTATVGTTYGVFGRANSSLGCGVYGEHWAATGAEPGVPGETGSTSGSAAGVVGRVESTTPGSYSAGVRGINNGTGGNGIGVYGSQDGSGWGVCGQTPNGRGVVGRAMANGGSGFGVFGETLSTTV